MTETTLYLDGVLRGDVTCPACGLVAPHVQMMNARLAGWWRRRWVAMFTCSSCGALFTTEVPRARGVDSKRALEKLAEHAKR
jgi:transposase-like protein